MADRWSDRAWAQRSDTGKARKWLMPLVVAGSMVGSGCAGVVMGSNTSAKGSTPPPTTQPPSTPPPPTPPTPTPTPTPQGQLSATPVIASFPSVTMGASSSQTITLQNPGTANVTISSASVVGAGFG